MKIHHLGYMVSDLDSAVEQFESIGYKRIRGRTIDELRQVAIQFIKKDQFLVEVIAPLSADSPIKTFLRKIGPSPYHLCYEVLQIDSAILKLKKQHFVVVQKPLPAKAIGGQMVIFLFNKEIGLIELVEKRK